MKAIYKDIIIGVSIVLNLLLVMALTQKVGVMAEEVEDLYYITSELPCCSYEDEVYALQERMDSAEQNITYNEWDIDAIKDFMEDVEDNLVDVNDKLSITYHF